MQAENVRPSILCFSGLDPSGGAGLQADIEAISSCGGHALPIATCLTVQNTTGNISTNGIEPFIIQTQAEALLEDMQVSACKIGVIPNENIARSIADILAQLPNVPIILDPILAPSRGTIFSDSITIQTIKEALLPHITVITPNSNELAILMNSFSDTTQQAQQLCSLGPKYVFVTGADNATKTVQNSLFTIDGLKTEFEFPRLPHVYHGSGCTLSSSLATFLASKSDIIPALEKAQNFTWSSLKNAEPLGGGQWIPNRSQQCE